MFNINLINIFIVYEFPGIIKLSTYELSKKIIKLRKDKIESLSERKLYKAIAKKIYSC